ncbi:rRNA methyltransferase [Actinomadura sp. NBRC 104425]|uniref:small ribosomal subunit Rsm22 family protein n=1 Tax=Actinomadura sp. NBRC 104425 TaxID=3032204 RepID=UPI0024A39245|nr:small ribosomal subunit Rsm22 family protein [Actinomadura sp. NBRC 104425]GLZ13447.1 rRNA methyltransferase [Actinomadura sp. NBRC 104425]
MAELPGDLTAALDEALRGADSAALSRSVRKLIHRYRDGFDPARRMVLGSAADVAAYAAYRMPATYAAVVAALERSAELMPGFSPRTHVDVGAGTGAAVWAAAEVWPSLEETTALEQAPEAISFGRRLAERADSPAVRDARWRRTVIAGPVRKPDADLVTMAYVLGELPPQVRADAVRSLAAGSELVVLVEPGTPAGYERIVEARGLLVELGLSVVAPCPHDRACPIPRGEDWCHFAERLNRTALHRRIKVGTLGFEDEKFCYVAAARGGRSRAAGRVVRRPVQRKGLVSLRLCTDADGMMDATVTKRHGEVYRAARKAEWGDAWPPVPQDRS